MEPMTSSVVPTRDQGEIVLKIERRKKDTKRKENGKKK
jgi:hypothetical protein